MKYLYKVVKGEVVAELFECDDDPKGWYDSPQAAEKAPKRKVKKDDDSSGTN